MLRFTDQTMSREYFVWFLLVCTFAVLQFGWGERISCNLQSDARVYNTSAGPVPDKLNVHLVAHTHDDVGWLKTVDQYYVGSNNSIQVAAVQYILDSVISALQVDPNRKFIYVEQAFFQRWWREQTSTTKKAVRKLVDRGQLEFINGGWCMHDEATTHYIDMIDQTTLGHRYIKEQFGKVPRIGWQIDPFGHSAVQGYLLGAEAGFDAVFFARADYQDVLQRRKDRTMEAIWRGSKSLGSSAQIFAGVLANHYEPPDGFSFDFDSSSPPVQDDPKLFDYNLEERVELFVQHAQEQAKQFRTNHLMWTMGDDFAYEYAHTWFKQMDKLVHYVNKDGRVNTFYSTPSLYVDMKEASNETWPLKLDDYFPYASSANGYWTGYFTSRPALKGYVRKLSAYLQVARQLEFIVGRAELGPSSDSLEEALAVLQHHDGVSGTEQQHVANDYTKRLFMSSVESEDLINRALAKLIIGREAGHLEMVTDKISNYRGHWPIEETVGLSMNLQQCPLSNISYCPQSEANLTGRTLAVIAYNPLGWERKETVRITVSDYKVDVFDSSGNLVPSQIMPVSQASRGLRHRHLKSMQKLIVSDEPLYEFLFECNTPPLGYATYYVKPSQNDSYSAEHSLIQENIQNHGALIQSNSVQFLFSSSTGLLDRLRRKDGVEVSLEQSFCWYNASDGNTDETRGQASGAYVFRPNSSSCFSLADNVVSTSIKGSLVEEVHQQLTSWVSQVVRIYKDAEHAEVEVTVGPIPIEDQLGKEIVTKLSTDLESNKVFYTDSNGRDFIKRVRDYRSDWELEVHEEIAGNYYPVNSGIYLTDNSTDFSILVDRSIGGSSISDGELELMVHRRLLHDDGKGVAEALNETTCLADSSSCEGLVVRGTFLMDIRPANESAFWRRNLIQRQLFPLQLVFSVINDEDGQLNISQYSAMPSGYQLPPNVALITLQELHDSSVLLRLAHLFEVDEDDVWSKVAVVDLQDIFAESTITQVEELSLTANQKKSEMKAKQWQIENDDVEAARYMRSNGFLGDGYQIELQPMEIRTFSVTLD